MDCEIMDLYLRGRELEGKSRDTNILYHPLENKWIFIVQPWLMFQNSLKIIVFLKIKEQFIFSHVFDLKIFCVI